MRKIYAIIALLCALNLSAADLKWAIKTEGGDVVFISNVSYLLYSDGSTAFSIVCKNGNTIANVKSASFVQADATGVGAVTEQGGVSAIVADQTLSIIGAKAGIEVAIVSLGGKTMLTTQTVQGKTDVNIGRLAAGAYVLKVGATAVKFQKK